MSRARALLRRVQPGYRGGARVLCYHLIGAGSTSPVDTPRQEFRTHLSHLARRATVVSLDQLTDPGIATATSPVALTFDDAFRNFAEQAWPVLEELALPATLFVPTDFVAGRGASPLRGVDLPALEWGELAELATHDLVTIGSHTVSHPDLRGLSDNAVVEELTASRQELEDRLGQPVRQFCYPRALWDARVERLVRDAYDLAVVGGGGVAHLSGNPHRIERTSVRSDVGFSIEQWLDAGIWLEERVADFVRRRR